MGFNIQTDTVKSIPLWVKFEQVSDSYWTQEGLSNLASAIGKPLYADELTSRFEVLPFAKVCLEFTIGKDLPSSIEALDLDPATEEERIVEVKVSYPYKPRICSSCHALGHIVGACPITKRH